MTAKYMYLSCYSDMSKRELFKNCHCPMDRIMIKQLINEIKIKHDGKLPDNYRLPFQSKHWSEVSWSKIVEEQTDNLTSIDIYNRFQDIANELANDKEVFR